MIREATKFFLAVIITLVAFQAGAEEKVPSGTVEIEEKEFALIIGGGWGKGNLQFQGGDYPFKISGLKVGGLGVSKVSAVGEVYDLFDLAQFPGTYVAGDYGITLGGGVGGVVMKNENNVYMRVKSTSEGIAVSLGASGVTVKMD